MVNNRPFFCLIKSCVYVGNLYVGITYIIPLANLLFRYTIPFVPVSSGDEHIIIIMTIISMRL